MEYSLIINKKIECIVKIENTENQALILMIKQVSSYDLAYNI